MWKIFWLSHDKGYEIWLSYTKLYEMWLSYDKIYKYNDYHMIKFMKYNDCIWQSVRNLPTCDTLPILPSLLGIYILNWKYSVRTSHVWGNSQNTHKNCSAKFKRLWYYITKLLYPTGGTFLMITAMVSR